MGKKNKQGIEFDKETQTNEWYTDLIAKSDLIEYTDVSGCYILKPRAQFIWDTIREYMDKKIKALGVKNASFPLFIPEKLLTKEEDHVEGFTPEVAWVTHSGSTKMPERLAVRPTSETIMYAAYSKWIRSHNDLPLKLNQWCNIVRWEFKNPIPFLRSREFYWQEGHTAFATKAEADEETMTILKDVYDETYRDLLAIPSLIGTKSNHEKFAGADYSLSCENLLPIGKAIQGCTSHHLGQNFAKAFDIKFKDKDQKEKYVYQNSWGFTTRSIGTVLMMHSDSHGLVLPPKVAENKVIIIPIGKREDNEDVYKLCEDFKHKLAIFNPILDDRAKSPGFKFNEAELKGYPIRIEVGSRGLEKGTVTLVRRDNLEKVDLTPEEVEGQVEIMLNEMHEAMYSKAKKYMDETIVENVSDLKEMTKLIKAGKVVKTVFANEPETDAKIKEITTGKTLNIPFDSKVKKGTKCPFTGKLATHEVYIGKSL